MGLINNEDEEEKRRRKEEERNAEIVSVKRFDELMRNGQLDKLTFVGADVGNNTATNAIEANTAQEENSKVVSVKRFDELMKNGQLDKLTFGNDTIAQDTSVVPGQEVATNPIQDLWQKLPSSTEQNLDKEQQAREEALKMVQQYGTDYSQAREEVNKTDEKVKEDIKSGELNLDDISADGLNEYYKSGKASDFPANSSTLKKDTEESEKARDYKESIADTATTEDKIADIEDELKQLYTSKKANTERVDKLGANNPENDFETYSKLVNETDTGKLEDSLAGAVEKAETAERVNTYLEDDKKKISDLEKQQKLLERQKEYEGYALSDDFEDKSNYDESKDDGTSVLEGIFSPDRGRTYSTINTLNRLKGKSEEEMTEEEKIDYKKAKDALGDGESLNWSQGGLPDFIGSIFNTKTDSSNTAVGEMTDDEVKMYNYIYNTKGEDKASEYLRDIAEGLNYKAAQKKAEENKGDTVKEIGYGIESGLDQFRQGTRSIVNGLENDEALPTSKQQYTGSMYREDLKDNGPKILGNSVGQVAYDLVNTTSNMLPSIVVSAATGGTGGAALGVVTLSASAGGNTFNEAWKNGVTKSQAAAYGITSGLSEAAMQYALGGISKLGGKAEGSILLGGLNKATAGKVAQFTSKIDDAIGSVIKSDAGQVAYGTGKNIAKSMFAEGREEYLQDALDPIFRNITLGEDNNPLGGFVSKDSLYSGLIGAISGGLFEGVGAHAEAKNAQVYKGIGSNIAKEDMSGILDYSKNVGEDLSDFTSLYDADTTQANAGKLKLAADQHIADNIYNADTLEEAEQNFNTVIEQNKDNAYVQKIATEAYSDFIQANQIDNGTTLRSDNQNEQNDQIRTLANEVAGVDETEDIAPVQVAQEDFINELEGTKGQVRPDVSTTIEQYDKKIESNYNTSIRNLAKTMDKDTATVYVDYYNAKIEPEVYHSVFNQVKQAAINEVPYQKIQDVIDNRDAFNVMRRVVGEDAVQSFYQAGKNELGKITSKTMSNEEKFVVNTIAEAFGKKVQYEDSISNGLYGANGKYQDGKIFISNNSTNRGRTVLAHESTHMMKDEAPEHYRAYEDYVIQNLKDSGSYDSMVEDYKKRIGRDDINLIHEEIASDTTETFLDNPDKFIEFAKKDTPTARKLINIVTNLIEKLKETVKKLTPNGRAAKLLQEDIDTYTEARDLWYEGVEKLMEQNASFDTTTSNTDKNINNNTKFSTKEPLSNQIDMVLSGADTSTTHVYIGETSNALLELGIKQLPMLITSAHTYSTIKTEEQAKAEGKYRKNVNYHGLGKDKFIKAIEGMKDPAMIIKSNNDTDDARIVLVTNVSDKEERFIVGAIKPSGVGKIENSMKNSNIVLSIYGRNNLQNYIDKAQKENRIIKINLDREVTPRVQFPSGILNQDYTNNLARYREIVNNSISKKKGKDARTSQNIRYSQKTFDEQYDNWDKKDPRQKFTVGNTSEVLKSIGIEDKTITMDAKKLIKIRNDHPEMTDEIIKKLPNVLENPMVVIDSMTKPGRPVIFGDVLTKKNKPVLVALELEPYGRKGKLIEKEIKIASAYVKDRPQYILSNSKYYYVNENKKKTRDWLKRTRLQLPVGENQYGLIDTIISTSDKNSNQNIRYSLKNADSTSLYSSKEDDFVWMEDNFYDESELKSTASILQEGTEALQKAHKEVDAAAVLKISKSILDDIGSQYDIDTLSDNLEKVFSYMQSTPDVSYDDMIRVMTEVALPVVDQIGTVDSIQKERYDNFVRTVLDTPINLSSTQREEIKNVSDNVMDWMNDNREHIKFRNDGTDLDSGVWSELVKESGYLLPADTREAEMPIVLAEFMAGMKPKVEYYDVDGATRENLAYDTALNIFKKYYGEYAAGQKVKNALDQKVEGYKKKIRKEINDAFHKEYDQTLREKRDTIEYLTDKLKDLTYELQQSRREQDKVKEGDIQEEIQKWKQKLDDVKSAKIEEIARIKARNRNSQIQRSYSKKETELRNKIKKVWSDLQKKATRPTDSSYIPEGLVKAVLDVCTSIDVVGNNQLMAQKMARLRDVYESIEPNSDKAKATDELFDANLYEQIKELQNEFQNRNLRELTYSDLKKVYDTMYAIKKQVIQSTKLIGRMKNVDAYQKCEKEIENIKSIHRDSKGQKAIDRVLHGMTSQGLSPLKFKSEMKRITGYAEDSVLVEMADDFNQGTVDAKKVEMEVENIFSDVLEDEKEVNKIIGKDKTDWVNFMGEVDKEGNPIKIPRSMLLSLAMHIENGGNLKHIIWGGLRIPDAELYLKGKKKESLERGNIVRMGNISQYAESNMSRAEIEEECEKRLKNFLSDTMTEYDKKLIKKSQKFFYDYSGKKINDISMKLKGYKIATVNKYFPIVTDKNFTKTDISGLVQNGTIEGMGMLKERVSASNPIILESILDTIDRHTNSVAKYVGYAIPVRNFNKVYNTTMMGYGDSIANELGKKFGTEGKTYIENFLTDIQSKRGDGPSTFLDKLRGNYAQGILTVNLSVMIKQAASLPTAAAVLGWENLANALPKFISNKAVKTDFDLIGKYTGLFWDRMQGKFNSELMDIKKTAPKFKIPFVTDVFMKGIEKIDQRTVGSLWYAAESKVSKENSHLEKGSDLYYEKVAEVFNEAVLTTQPMYETTQQADISRNPNKAVKLLFMFKTQPMQNFNILFDATSELHAVSTKYKNGQISKEYYEKSKDNFKAAITSQIASAVTFSVMSLVAGTVLNRLKPYKDDDDKLTVDSVGSKLISDVFSSIAGSFVGGSELYEWLSSAITGDTYYGLDVSVIENVSDLASGMLSLQNDISKINDAETKEERTKYMRKTAKQTESLLEDVGNMFGIPYSNVKKISDAVTSRVADFKVEDMYTTPDNSEVKKEVYADGNATYEELHKALDNGERTEKQITSLVKSSLKEMDTRVEEAAKSRMEGDTEGYTRKAKEIIKDGFSQDDVVSAINSKMNELSKDKKASTESKKKGLYSTDDVIASLKNGGDTQSVINEIMDIGKENGTDKTSSIKSAVKKAYEKEYQEGDENKRKVIESMLSGLTVAGENVFDEEYFYKMSMKYSGKDVAADLQEGKTYDAQQKINDIYAIKYQHALSTAKTPTEKKNIKTSTASSIKSAITSVYKPLYQSGDNKTKQQIIQTLIYLRAGEARLYSTADFQRWNKQ